MAKRHQKKLKTVSFISIQLCYYRTFFNKLLKNGIFQNENTFLFLLLGSVIIIRFDINRYTRCSSQFQKGCRPLHYLYFILYFQNVRYICSIAPALLLSFLEVMDISYDNFYLCQKLGGKGELVSECFKLQAWSLNS